MKIRDEVFRQLGAVGCVEWRTLSSGVKWLDGTVRTPYGIVEVMVSPRDDYSRVDFVWGGKHHIRTFHGRSFTKAGIVRVASRFARAVAGA